MRNTQIAHRAQSQPLRTRPLAHQRDRANGRFARQYASWRVVFPLIWIGAFGAVALVACTPSAALAQNPVDLAEEAVERGDYCGAEELYEAAREQEFPIDEAALIGAAEECEAALQRACEQRQTEGFVLVEAGSFQMGSPPTEEGRYDDEVQHWVTLTRDFYLQQQEVTQGEWRSLMGDNPSDYYYCGDDCPVENVNWYETLAYANALSDAGGLQPCYQLSECRREVGMDLECGVVRFEGLDCEGYRLPTEAEWEYAARAGTTGARYGVVDDVAWYSDNALAAQPVQGLEANAWGLHDMLGNVREWVWDWYGDYPTTSTIDPLGPSMGQSRVLRGGTWNNPANFARSAFRSQIAPFISSEMIGFRLARSAI